MSADTIRLHRVATGQGLPADALSRQRNQRLHLFPGRALGEDELDRLQAWSDPVWEADWPFGAPIPSPRDLRRRLGCQRRPLL